MVQDQQTYRRAGNAAILGFSVQALLATVMAVVGLWAQSPALHAATWHLLGGLPVWGILWLIYKQHQIERTETLEVEQLSRSSVQTAAIFETQADELRVARRRLDSLYKWGLYGVSLTLAVYLLVVGGFYVFLAYRDSGNPALFTQRALGASADANAGILMAFMAGIAFVGFIVGRYAAGMTVEKEWQLLRGGAGYLMGTVVVAGMLLVGALFALFGKPMVMAWLGLLVPGFMVLLGLEVILSFLGGAYRPRKPGEVPRPAFDSRVLGWLTKPESLAKIINETVNYQFGFEISRSWFYLLLSKAITPLIVTGLAILWLASSLVIVQPEENAIITLCGSIRGEPVQSGLHLKAPWPLGGVQRFRVGALHQAIVGSYQEVKTGMAILWTNQHVEGKEEFIITAPTLLAQAAVKQDARALLQELMEVKTDPELPTALAGSRQSPAVSLVAAQMHVFYRIENVKDYALNMAEPTQMIDILADAALTRYFAGRDIDTLLARGRETIGRELLPVVQAAADQMKLGIKIAYVGMIGVHPPKGGDAEGPSGPTQPVAAAFHEQVGALQERETAIWKARQERIQTLATVAGSEEMAVKIAVAVTQLESLRTQAEKTQAAGEGETLSQQIREKEAEIEALLVAAPGQASQIIYDARAQRWETGTAERSKSQAFPAQVAAHRHAPKYFRSRAYLDALAEGLVKPRKYIMMNTDSVTAPVYRLDLKDSTSALDDFTKP